MSDETPFLYFEVLPPAPLREYVHAYWGFDVRDAIVGTRHVVWPDGCLSLLCRVTPGGECHAGFSGPRTEPLEVPVASGERYRGVRLWPWAIRPLLDVDPASVRDRNGAVTTLLGPDAGLLQDLRAEQVLPALEELLLARAQRAGAVDAIVRGAAEAIARSAGKLRIADVAAAAAVGERQLRRRFRSVTGLSPKEYARVRRLRSTAVARLGGGESWSRLAAQHGFADQAHLVREVATMTGLTPGGFADRLRLIEHRDVRP